MFIDHILTLTAPNYKVQPLLQAIASINPRTEIEIYIDK
jgi:hypothetical protein